MTIEATSAAGATVNFAAAVTASDSEDGDLTESVICVPASGSVFALGATVVNCSVEDSGGLTAEGSFTITIVDTTAPTFTSIPTGTVNRIAESAAGWSFDVSSFGITAADVGGVSEPTTIACTPLDGTMLTIGSLTQVSCTATDAAVNTSAPSTFNVFVTLDVVGIGFLTPLRMDAPFSAHKQGSTIPHKFPAPRYADGSPVTHLASGLNLTLKFEGGVEQTLSTETMDLSAGSTAWRYDADSGHYIFNVKSAKSWQLGMWVTTASYMDIVLAQTEFDLRK